MATIAEVHVPATEFPLENSLSRVADARFDIEHIVATEDDRVRPFVWAKAGDFEAMDAALTADPCVEDLTLLYGDENARLYRMEWDTRIRVITHLLTESDATILNLSGVDGEWVLRIRFPDRDTLSTTYAFCRNRGLTFDFREIYEPNEATQRGHFGLTDIQQEALVRAVECGYFDIPQSVTMDEVAETLGISRQAVSERLRRGHRRLIESALILGRTDADPNLLSA